MLFFAIVINLVFAAVCLLCLFYEVFNLSFQSLTDCANLLKLAVLIFGCMSH